MKYIYIGISTMVVLLVIYNMIKSNKIYDKVDSALVLIPFILRILLIK